MLKKIVIIACVLIFLCNSEFLHVLYPNAESNYEQFLKYYYLDDKINEILITLLFWFAVMAAKIKLVKAFAVFGFAISFASAVDKVLFNTFDYLYTDIVVLICATCFAYYVVYQKEK